MDYDNQRPEPALYSLTNVDFSNPLSAPVKTNFFTRNFIIKISKDF